jgi:hypothetical protein
MRHGLILGVVALTLGFACSNTSEDHTVRASDYNQSCSGDSDCVAVYAGVIGCCWGCPNAAVAMTSYASFQHDLTVKTPRCVPAPPCFDPTANACGTPSPRCDHGLCILGADAGQM